jgi:single-strand DNA-binding protein
MKGDKMPKSINQVTIMGNLTKDPVLKYTPSGVAVISFSMATNRSWIDKASGEKKEDVQFHNVVFWQKSAEVISQYVFKGNALLIQGRLQTRSWDDKQTGVKKYITEIVGDAFWLLNQKGGKVENTVDNSESPVEDIIIPDEFETEIEKMTPKETPTVEDINGEMPF